MPVAERSPRYTPAIHEVGLLILSQVVPEGSSPAYYKYVIVAQTPT
jgi:hypothetical protein